MKQPKTCCERPAKRWAVFLSAGASHFSAGSLSLISRSRVMTPRGAVTRPGEGAGAGQAGLTGAGRAIAHEIVEQAGGADLALVGIKNRGRRWPSASPRRSRDREQAPGRGRLDITLYATTGEPRRAAEGPQHRIPFPLKGSRCAGGRRPLTAGRSGPPWSLWISAARASSAWPSS